MPLDPLRVLTSMAGRNMIDGIRQEIDALYPRRRARRTEDAARWQHALEVLLANLVLAAFNRVDPERFIALSFNANDYSGSTLSVKALTRARDGLKALGLVEGSGGYQRVVEGAVRHARRTRLRATPALRTRFASLNLRRTDVGWQDRRDLIILREPEEDALPEPPDVTASRVLLDRLNEALARAQLYLPDEAWARVTERYRTGNGDEDDRLVAGEETTGLYRIFKGGWDRGGRLYGGWWINLPKDERRRLNINGAAVVERDFARLHPTMLFARSGVVLDFDIYAVPGYEGDHVRELGKRTFNRLLNKTAPRGVRLLPTALDRVQLPSGARFADYVAAFVERLGPVAQWLGTGEGLRLQREDSDLAIAILARLLDQGVLALPVHDSFIVAKENEAALAAAMRGEFARRYGFDPVIR